MCLVRSTFMENDNSLSAALFNDNLVDELGHQKEEQAKAQTPSNAATSPVSAKLTCKIIVLGDSGVGMKNCFKP